MGKHSSRSPDREKDRKHRTHSRRSDSPARDSRRGDGYSRHRDHSPRRDGRQPEHPRHRDDSYERRKSRRTENQDDRHRRKRENATPSDDEDLLDIRKMGLKPITEDDYFVKSAEFKYWLRDARAKDFHDMSSDQTRRYFRKFVRRWNDGALREKYYRSPPSSPRTSRSRWGTDPEHRSLHHINNSDHDDDDDDRSPSPGPRLDLPGTSAQRIGPSLPTASDRQMALETQREASHLARKAERASTRRTALERAEEVAPRLQGKEGKMAEKRATNSANREMRDKEVGGLELDEGTLMGEESSFQAALRARDAAAARRRDKREEAMASAKSANEERLAERRQKESETMQMLQAMARQRYG